MFRTSEVAPAPSRCAQHIGAIRRPGPSQGAHANSWLPLQSETAAAFASVVLAMVRLVDGVSLLSVLGLSISTSDIDGRCNCCEKQVLGSCQQKRSPSCKSHTGVTSPRRAMVAISSRLSLFVPPSGGTPRSYCSPEGRVQGIHRAPGRWNRRGCDTVGVRWLSTSTPLERSIIP